jgi:hypothetical protein
LRFSLKKRRSLHLTIKLHFSSFSQIFKSQNSHSKPDSISSNIFTKYPEARIPHFFTQESEGIAAKEQHGG